VIVGKNGTYLAPASSPVVATLVIDPPVATTGQCGEATVVDNTDQACRLLAAGDKVLCKQPCRRGATAVALRRPPPLSPPGRRAAARGRDRAA
jgi:hypothetical protein